MSEELLVALDSNGILNVTMNRPAVHNAFDDKQISRLTTVLEDAASNDQIRVVVLSATGKSFSAGGDINYMRAMGGNTYQENIDDAGRLALLMKTLNFLPKLTIARVQGAAFGGGVGLVSCCDLAIGTPNAKFSLSEIKLGMIPATIAPYVIRTIGQKASRRLFMTAEVINAQQAKDLGLLTDVVPEETLDDAILSIASAALKNAPQATQSAKQAVFDYADGPVTDAMIADTVSNIANLRDSDEGREGLSAFLEKRKPSWIQ